MVKRSLKEVVLMLSVSACSLLPSCISISPYQYRNPNIGNMVIEWGNTARENKKWGEALDCYRKAGDIQGEERTLFEMYISGKESREDYELFRKEIKRFLIRNKLSERLIEQLREDGERRSENDFARAFDDYFWIGDYKKCRDVLEGEVKRHGATREVLRLSVELDKVYAGEQEGK